MANIASLAVSLTAYTSAFDKKMRKSRSTVRVFKSAVDRVDKALLRIGVVAAAAAAAGLVLVTKNAFQSMDAIAKLSARIDVSTEFLVAYGHAATLAGTSSEEFSKAIEIFVRRLGELTQGTGEAKYGLEALGLNMKDMLAMNPEQAFAKVADGIKGLGTQAEKAAVAYRFFGRSGSKMLNLLESDTSGVIAAAERLGITFSEFDAKKIQDANDAMADMKAVLRGVGQQIAITISPAITKMVKKFLSSKDAVKNLGRKIGKVVVNTMAFVKTVTPLLKWVAGIYVAIKAVTLMVAALRATAVGLAVVQALGGPAGWITLAAGAAIATAAVLATKASFDGLTTGIESGMESAENSIKGVAATAEDMGAKVEEVAESIENAFPKSLDRLYQEADRIGKDKFEIAELEMKLANQYNSANAKYLERIKNTIKEKEAVVELGKAADKLKESLESPAEKFKKLRDQYAQMLEAKLISQGQFDKAISAASKEHLNPASLQSAMSIPDMQIKSYRSENVDVTALGSSREISPIVKKQEELVEIGKETNRHLEKLVKKEGLE